MRRVTAAAGSAAFFAVAPGVVAGLVPWMITGWRAGDPIPPGRWAVGVALVAAGTAVLVPAFVRFAHDGLGTPAPMAPTDHLVVTGPYRWVRNPMYLAVSSTIAGQAVLFPSAGLLAYWVATTVAMVLFSRLVEEPSLRARFGTDYDEYRSSVRGWLPRRPAVG